MMETSAKCQCQTLGVGCQQTVEYVRQVSVSKSGRFRYLGRIVDVEMCLDFVMCKVN